MIYQRYHLCSIVWAACGRTQQIYRRGHGTYNDTANGNLDFDDGVKARFGSNNRLQISAQNSLSRFRLSGNVPLTISKDTTEDIAKFISVSGVPNVFIPINLPLSLNKGPPEFPESISVLV